jgi:hypothetical protein
MRARTAHTVETGSLRVAAMRVLVKRRRRSPSISASTFGAVRLGWHRGADERSSMDSPASWRASHR